jgi:hypothetical protein
MSTDKPRRRYQYVVRNGNGLIIRAFGCDYHAACEFAKRSEGVGLHYNLTVRKYLVTGGSQLGETEPFAAGTAALTDALAALKAQFGEE